MSTRDLGLVDLSGRGARVLILVFLVTMAALALWSIEGVRAPVSTAVAAALFTIACVVAVRDRATRMSLLPALIVITIGVANTILLSWHLIPRLHAVVPLRGGCRALLPLPAQTGARGLGWHGRHHRGEGQAEQT